MSALEELTFFLKAGLKREDKYCVNSPLHSIPPMVMSAHSLSQINDPRCTPALPHPMTAHTASIKEDSHPPALIPN